MEVIEDTFYGYHLMVITKPQQQNHEDQTAILENTFSI